MPSIHDIENEQRDQVNRAKRVRVVADDTGSGAVYTTLWDSTTTADTIYLGEATPGTTSDQALWRMQRINTATGKIEWADGGTFTEVWDNRESLTYA